MIAAIVYVLAAIGAWFAIGAVAGSRKMPADFFVAAFWPLSLLVYLYFVASEYEIRRKP